MSLKLDLCAAIVLISFGPPAEAHDIYSHLKDRLGNGCCNEQDCRPAPYRVTPAGGHWCGDTRHMVGYGMDYSTYCAILPPNAAAIFGAPFALREGPIQPVP